MGVRTFSRRILGPTAGCIVPLLLTSRLLGGPLDAQQLPTATAQATPTIDPTTTALPGVPLTPTIDPTVTALQKETLQHQNEWLWNNSGPLLSTAAIVITALFGFYRWRYDQRRERAKRAQDHRIDREKRDEDRFQTVVGGLGSERVKARVGAAIMLRTFLRPGYEQFYSQAFDLAVAHLRLRKADPNTPEPLDSLSQALITVLKESFPRARDGISQFAPEHLDATGVHLDNAYLSGTDLRKIRLRGASLRGAYFWRAHLEEAYLKHSNLESAFLVAAHLEGADLGDTVLKGSNLREAHLQGAHLKLADLTIADFTDADLTDTQPESARSLQGTILRGVRGLTAAQLAACAEKGAIVDDVRSP